MADQRLFYRSGIGHGERINLLSDFEFIVWTAYELSADDFGVMRLSAVTLKADHDRLSNKSDGAIERALMAAVRVGLLEVFEYKKRRYVCQLDWQDRQRIKYPSATTNPLPPSEIVAKCTAKTRELFAFHGANSEEKSVKSGKKKSQALPDGVEGSGELSPTTTNTDTNTNAPKKETVTPFRTNGQPPLALGLRRFKVWRFMLDDFIERLGEHADRFDLEDWLHRLDRRDSGIVPSGKDGWVWLQTEFMAECVRRGIGATSPSLGKQTTRLVETLSQLSDRR